MLNSFKTVASHFLFILVLYPVLSMSLELPRVRVTVRVVDESNAPIESAHATFVFCGAKDPAEVVRVKGLTTAEGLFTANGHSLLDVGSGLRKAGYYFGWVNFITDGNPPIKHVRDGKLQPYGATNTTVLRRIENQVPMYAKCTWTTLPIVPDQAAYDLVAGDWVAPFGYGHSEDLKFVVRMNYTNESQFEIAIKMAFANQRDGIQPANLPKEYSCSEFIWDRFAPETGYLPEWHAEQALPGKPYRIEDIEKQKFYFRVRTVEKDGKIVSALYGKLSEGFQLAPEGSNICRIRLCYYLNPKPLDRNMEFDMKHNLFKDLPEDEEPRSP